MGTTQYLAFMDWLLSISNIFYDLSIYINGLIAHLFSLLNNIPLRGLYQNFFIYLPIEGHLACIQALAIMNKAVINTL